MTTNSNGAAGVWPKNTAPMERITNAKVTTRPPLVEPRKSHIVIPSLVLNDTRKPCRSRSHRVATGSEREAGFDSRPATWLRSHQQVPAQTQIGRAHV